MADRATAAGLLAAPAARTAASCPTCCL